ncbi:MAG TPA: ABC transporter permease [Planctomycetota bacterium]|nr:ABC transporter permease [Planctomycetota bacterium]
MFMEWINAARIGLAGLSVHKFRAALSMLGIIFGVASVVAVIAVSEGARGEVLKQLAALGASNIMVDDLDWKASSEKRDLKKATRLHSEGLTVDEANSIAHSCALISEFAPLRKVPASVRLDEQPINAEVIGTTPSYFSVMGLHLQKGRWLVKADDDLGRRVCVIDETLRQEHFRLTTAIGRTMVIDHEPYEIVGILENVETSSDAKYTVDDVKQLNRRVYIPLQAALSRTTLEPLSDEVSRVIFQCRSAEDVHAAASVLNRFYESSHNMEAFDQRSRDYSVSVAQDLIKQTEESQRIFNYVMACSAGISLVVGGIGIMNIMLANVTERRREIGTRRAVGATQADILRQFLFESLSICLLGGLLGCAVGVGFTYLVESSTGWHTKIAWWSMFAALGVSLLDGVMFGTYPAWKAGKLDPIEALRYE